MAQRSETALGRKDLLLLAVLFVTALGIRLYFHPFFRVISADGVGYVGAARAFAQGNFTPSLTYGFVYPALTALVSFATGDFELAGRTVSMVMGSLLAVPVYLLGAEFFSRRAGAMAAILCTVWPCIRMWSGEVMTQASYMTLLLSGVYLLWRAWNSRSWLLSSGAGAVLALSFLTRPEALVLFAALLAALCCRAVMLRRPWREILPLFLGACGGFLLLLIPDLCYIHSCTGAWQLTGKMGNTLADALSEYLGRPDLKHEPGFAGIGIMDVLQKYPGFLPVNLQKNLRDTWNVMLPPYLWALSCAGFLCSGWSREAATRRLYLLATFAPLGVILCFFFVGPEYLQPYLPVMFLWAAHAVCTAEARLLALCKLERWPLPALRSLNPSLGLVATVLFAAGTIYAQVPADRDKPYHYSDDGGRYDHKRIGLLLKERLPKDCKIMTRWGRISFYCEMDRVDMPQAGLGEILATARRERVRFIVVDGMLLDVRPQLGAMLLPLLGEEKVFVAPGRGNYQPFPGVKLYMLNKDPSSVGVAVYEIS